MRSRPKRPRLRERLRRSDYRKPEFSSPRTIASGTGILGPETKGRNRQTSTNGDRDRFEWRRKSPANSGLSRQSPQSAKTADWVVAEAVERNWSPTQEQGIL